MIYLFSSATCPNGLISLFYFVFFFLVFFFVSSLGGRLFEASLILTVLVDVSVV